MDQLLPMEREKRLLARLGPKLNSLRPRYGAATTSASLLSTTDVAACVSYIRRPGPNGEFIPDHPKQRLVLYTWAGHNSMSDVRKVLDGLVVEASKHVTWKPEPGELDALASLALLEHCYPKPCRTCSATGVTFQRVEFINRRGNRQERMETVVCPVCNGTGRRPWSRQRLAKMFGVTEYQWRRVWVPRYVRMSLMIRWMEMRGLAQIRRALRRG